MRVSYNEIASVRAAFVPSVGLKQYPLMRLNDFIGSIRRDCRLSVIITTYIPLGRGSRRQNSAPRFPFQTKILYSGALPPKSSISRHIHAQKTIKPKSFLAAHNRPTRRGEKAQDYDNEA
jgi:hypothetical protein